MNDDRKDKGAKRPVRGPRRDEPHRGEKRPESRGAPGPRPFRKKDQPTDAQGAQPARKPRPFAGKDRDAKPRFGGGGNGDTKPRFGGGGGDARPRPDGRGGDTKPRFGGRDGDTKPRFGGGRDGDTKPRFGGGGGDARPRPDGRGGDTKPRFGGRDGDGKPRFGGKPASQRDRTPAAPHRRPEPAQVSTVDRGEERIAKRLARAGVASRRDAEEMIAAGRVSVNGKVLESPALNVGSNDMIEVDGAAIPQIERTRLFLFHKPSGLVTTNKDPEGRRTVFDVLPKGLPRLMTVGRLDINTEGLLLLTNDGGLARVLELPTTGWLRRYRVRVHGKVEIPALEALKDGIAVDGVFYGSIEATLDREQGANAWISVGLREGKNREVKNVMNALGLEVTRLIRVSYGPFQLGELAEGEIQELRGRHLRDQLGEKLIADAGADFDAPVVNEFSNKPVSNVSRPEGEAARPREKRDRQDIRDKALERLTTRRDGPGAGKPQQKRDETPRSRTSNVWMAPGARALGPKQAAKRDADTEGRRYAGKPKPRPASKSRDADGPDRPQGRPGGGKRFGGDRQGRPDRKR